MVNILTRRKFSKGLRAYTVSDRSGLPFRHTEMVKEPGTNLIVHYTESDGVWNLAWYEKHLNIPKGDAQRLEDPRDYVIDDDIEQWYIDESAL